METFADIKLSDLNNEQLAELEAKIEARKERERKAKERERKEYEASRAKFVTETMAEAKELKELLSAFKTKVVEGMDEHAIKLSEYGQIRSNSKGGFTVKDGEELYAISRRRDTEPTWDERAHKGVELIKEFLYDKVKKRDKDVFEMLMTFLVKNKNGDLEYANVMGLLQHEDRFKDERWMEGIALLKEGYKVVLKGFGYEFKTKGTDGKWQSVILNFSSI